MALYHINYRGEPALCRARPGNCPLESQEPQAHGTQDEVMQAIAVYYGDTGLKGHVRVSKKEKILTLTDELFKASQAYYQGGVSELSDDEYDDRKTYLQHLVSSVNDPKLTNNERVRAVLDERVAAGTEAHNDVATQSRTIPMLSQRKADTREDVEAYFEEAVGAGAKGFKLQAKLDGISFAAVYQNGALAHCTGRGDGTKGQDYTQAIKDGSVKVQGLPLQLEGDLANGSVELRGELFIRNSEFQKSNEERAAAGAPTVSHPQIMVSSGINRGHSSATFTFVVFTQIKLGGKDSFTPYDSDSLAQNGFNEIAELTRREWAVFNPDLEDFSSLTDISRLMDQVDNFGEARPHLDVPTDGIVIKPTNEVEMLDCMGSTAHHPKSQIAFKYTGAMGVAEMKEIKWTVRSDGEVVAAISFEPVELGGKRFGVTTLPYATILDEMDLGPDSDVVIEKYRDQAAKFRSLQTKSSKPYRSPTSCPSCSGPLERVENRPDPGNRLPHSYTSLICANQTCPARVKAGYGRRAIDYDGLGPAKVAALVEAGIVKTPADIAKLITPDLFRNASGAYPKGITAKTAEKLAESVREGREALRDNLNLGLMSLNLRGLTQDRAVELSKTYKSTDEIMTAPVRKLSESFSEDLHETEQHRMLPLAEECAARLQKQLRESVDLQTYKNEGIVF